MVFIKFVLSVLIVVFLYIAITGLFMRGANYIGEQLRFGKLFENLLRKVRKK